MERTKIILGPQERKELEQFCKKGKRSVRLVNRAKIILAFDTSAGRIAQKQEAIAERIGVSRQSVNNARRDFLSAGSVSEFLQRKKRLTPPIAPKVTGDLEARIIAMACGAVPQGYARWTVRLLAAKCVELQYSDTMSRMTISRLLKKHNLSLI